MSVMQDIQAQFSQFFIEKRRPIASVAMNEADYKALTAELLPEPQWSAVEIDLLGKERLAELDLSKYRIVGISKILDYTDGNLVQVLRDATLQPGTFVLSEA